MLLKLRPGRRLQTYMKIGVCLLLGFCYFAFLFRESRNAFEQNKERINIINSNNNNNNNNNENDADSVYAAMTASEHTGVLKQQLKIMQRQKEKKQQQRQQQQQQLRKESTTLAPPPPTLDPIYEYSEELHSFTEKELQRRRDHLAAVCERYKLQEKYPPNTWEFFVLPGHNLIWCNVFKAASSTWMYYINILGGYDIKYLQRTHAQSLELARKRFPRPELDELLELLPTALSFLFVRDPFERIVSAYRDKLEGNRKPFYKSLSKKIAHQQKRPCRGTHRRPRCGPTFDEFVRFLIAEHAAGKPYNEHWAPIYKFCTPCSVNFTIIGKTDSFQRDSEFIIRSAGLESLLLGKLAQKNLNHMGNWAVGRQTKALMERYFGELERSTLDQLLNIYRIDFELFDYDYRKYYDMVEPWTMPAALNSTEFVQHSISTSSSSSSFSSSSPTSSTSSASASSSSLDSSGGSPRTEQIA